MPSLDQVDVEKQRMWNNMPLSHNKSCNFIDSIYAYKMVTEMHCLLCLVEQCMPQWQSKGKQNIIKLIDSDPANSVAPFCYIH